MPSSTSSSDVPPDGTSLDRAPNGPWLRIWLAALLTALLVFVGWELFWRQQGFRSMVRDNAELWASVRARARGPEAVVLIGSSRMHADLHIGELSRLTGARPVQLSLANTHPLPILEDLAADRSVSGVVICGVTPSIFFDPFRVVDERAEEYLRYYREGLASPSKRAEAWIGTVLEGWLVSAVELRPHNVFRSVRAGRWPEPEKSHIWTFRRDRHRLLSFDDPETRADRVARVADFSGVRPAQPTELERLLERVRRCVERIRSRGGRVLFVRLPSDGRVRLHEDRMFPRERYWEALAFIEGAAFVHVDDHPELRSFRTAEGSHLDYRSAGPFTRSLVSVLGAELSPDHARLAEAARENPEPALWPPSSQLASDAPTLP